MGEKIHEEVEPEDTITTGFFSTKNRSTLSRNANKFDELNLWLYDADQNKNLEEEFYETMANTKMMGQNSTARVKNGRSAVLPAITGRRKWILIRVLYFSIECVLFCFGGRHYCFNIRVDQNLIRGSKLLLYVFILLLLLNLNGCVFVGAGDFEEHSHGWIRQTTVCIGRDAR